MSVKGKAMFFGCFFCLRIDGLFGWRPPKEKEGRMHGGAVGSRSHRQMARGESGFLFSSCPIWRTVAWMMSVPGLPFHLTSMLGLVDGLG
jgi:hypothetical protein